jgi:2,4-didehydro-3-deoxy-L-rhamnonate hydrolase
MKIASVRGRLGLVTTSGVVDVERASHGRFDADPQAIYASWDEFRQWASGANGEAAPLAEGELDAPTPRPTQVFAIGLNYRAHAAEAGMALPERPATFTKFPTCITAPYADLELPSDKVDWEVELVVILGRRAHRVKEADGWAHVAGLAVGQDYSERVVQFAAGAQFSLGKSFPGFGPIGPFLVTTDELRDPNDLELRCTVNGEIVQRSRTSDMAFSVPQLVAELSSVVPLLPGDVIFTGTPAGVGVARKPPLFLKPGDVVESTIEGVGTIRNRCTKGV